MDGKEPTLPGPDFPTGGTIINKNAIPNIMKTGHGTIYIRAKYEVTKNLIIFTEIPYGTTIEALISEIGQFCEENPTLGVNDIKDLTDNSGIKIVIEYDKSANPKAILDKLFAKTNLQTSFSYNQVALVNKIPTELNLTDCCRIYVEHNISCLKRETMFDLKKAEERLHIVEGLLIALEDIDNVIQLIKKSANSADAKANLMSKYKLDEEQAKAILSMRLSSLAKLEKIELENEKTNLITNITDMKALLNSEILLKKTIKDRLMTLVAKYGDTRRTTLEQIEIPKEEKEIVAVEPEKCVVVLTDAGNIKRISNSTFKIQKRNGKGVKTQDEITTAIIRTNTVDNLMIFTNKGRMYRLLVDNVPAGTNTSKGVPVTSLIELEPNEKPTLIYSIYRDTTAKFVVFVTKRGLIKRTPLEEYTGTKKKTGISAITLKDNDELASVFLANNEDVVVLSKSGYSIRFNLTEVSPTSRVAAGVKSMNLIDDEVLTALPVRHAEDDIAVFSSLGLGKRLKLSDLSVQKRGGRGVICYKGNDELADAAMVNNEDSLLVIGDKNSICISCSEIPILSKISCGNSIIQGNIKKVSKI